LLQDIVEDPKHEAVQVNNAQKEDIAIANVLSVEVKEISKRSNVSFI
jgi:hypothetical protein